MDPNSGDYHLLAGSPCIDAADPNFVPDPNELDIDGENRIQYCRADIGPDETPYFFDCNTNGIGDGCDLSQQTSFDCNGNARPDECDMIAAGDYTADGFVGWVDFVWFDRCMAGPDLPVIPPAAGCAAACLAAFDFEPDGDVDFGDFGTLQVLASGS